MTPDIRALLSNELACAGTAWVMGEFGALAELHHAGDFELEDLRIELCNATLEVQDRDCTLVAYELLSAGKGGWQHGLAFCLPRDQAMMSRRQTVTELHDTCGWTFDLGLGLVTVDYCVQTHDPLVARRMRNCQGCSFLADESLYDFLREASPVRQLRSRLSRLTVRSRIPASHERPALTSHTHLLPRLLRPNRSHSANLPIPTGFLPCLYAYPEHPAQDAAGMARPFDMQAHRRFQSILKSYGPRAQIEAKQAAVRALESASREGPGVNIGDRHGRQGLRIALRQYQALAACIEASV